MGKLLERLNDASRSGVYRSGRSDELLDAVRGSALRVAAIDLAGVMGKEELMARISRSLAFPSWFGGTWDALEDCLTDLSWSTASGHILLLTNAEALPGDERGILLDVLDSAAAWWGGRSRPFFAVFVGGMPALPELYRAGK